VANSLESLRRERQRKLQVRESFSRGLMHFRGARSEAAHAFLLACADYLAAGQRRLVDQDRRLVDLLAPRVPAAQRDDHAAMQALRERLDLADRTLRDFQAAVAALRARGVAELEEFDAAAVRFLDVLVNVLGARSHSLRHLTTTLLGEDDWRRIADVTSEFEAQEEAAFARIGSLAPPGLEPEKMSVEARPSPQQNAG
jgi:predicted secreted protein